MGDGLAPAPVARLRPMIRVPAENEMIRMWKNLTPGAPEQAVKELIHSFVSRGVSKKDFQAILSKVTEVAPNNPVALEKMVVRRFQPEEFSLFINSTATERKDLVKAWHLDGNVDIKGTTRSVAAPLGGLVKIGAVSGSFGALIFFCLGVATGHHEVADTARVAGDMLYNLDDIAKAIADHKLPQLVHSTSAQAFSYSIISFCVGLGPLLAREMLSTPIEDTLKETKRLLKLEVRGVFSELAEEGGHSYSMPGGNVDLKQTLQELDAIPMAYLPLLTHLKPKELVVFLSSDEDVRTSMMQHHEPDIDQRITAGRAMNPGRIASAMGGLRQEMSDWKGEWGDHQAITLPSFITAIQIARDQKRADGDFPAARPRFSPSGS